MTRKERSQLRRKRNKIIALSLLGCMLLFLAGVRITYDVMLKVMGLPKTGSIFSFRSTGQALRDIADGVPGTPVGEAAEQIRLLAQRVLEKIRDAIGAMTRG